MSAHSLEACFHYTEEMKFVTRSNGQSVALNDGVTESRLNLIPADLSFSGVMLGRIKGTGVSLRGLEFMVLVTTPTEAIVFGRDGVTRWRKPLAGMTASNQALDAVRFVSADGEEMKFITGSPSRSEIINHMVEAELNSRNL